jgi:hypothetical protein
MKTLTRKKKGNSEEILDFITVIAKKEVEKLWKLQKLQGENKSFFPSDYAKGIENYIANDYYIIYLSGLPILEQIKSDATDKFSFKLSSLNEKEISTSGEPGYYLVKLRRKSLSIVSNHYKLMPCPKDWRRANLREACEIILNILFIDQKKIYQQDWHICPDTENQDKILKIRFSILKDKEIIMENQLTKDVPSNINSITIRRL